MRRCGAWDTGGAPETERTVNRKRAEKIRECLRDHCIWLLVLLLMDALFTLFLWLMDARGFYALSGIWIVCSVIVWCGVVVYLYIREGERERKAMDFLDCPDKETEEAACECVTGRDERLLREVGSRLREAGRQLKEQQLMLEDYEEYIESWAHEIKTPLALMTLMLDNRKDEMGKEVHHRMEYSRNQMQGYVEQMLFYARMRAVHKDYLFGNILLQECCEEVLEQFGPFFEEHNFEIVTDIPELSVVTDQRSFCFLLGQIIHNAVKYRRQDGIRPQLCLEGGASCKDGIILRISDNGIGVKECDMPFIFDKGFTGDSGGLRRKATGMGLYLVKQLASDLNIGVKAESEYGKGFMIELFFPSVR